MFQLELNSFHENNPPFIEFDSYGSIHGVAHLHVYVSKLIEQCSRVDSKLNGEHVETFACTMYRIEKRLIDEAEEEMPS